MRKEQLEEKNLELRAEIHALRTEKRDNLEKYEKIKRERDEALSQIATYRKRPGGGIFVDDRMVMGMITVSYRSGKVRIKFDTIE